MRGLEPARYGESGAARPAMGRQTVVAHYGSNPVAKPNRRAGLPLVAAWFLSARGLARNASRAHGGRSGRPLRHARRLHEVVTTLALSTSLAMLICVVTRAQSGFPNGHPPTRCAKRIIPGGRDEDIGAFVDQAGDMPVPPSVRLFEPAGAQPRGRAAPSTPPSRASLSGASRPPWRAPWRGVTS